MLLFRSLKPEAGQQKGNYQAERSAEVLLATVVYRTSAIFNPAYAETTPAVKVKHK